MIGSTNIVKDSIKYPFKDYKKFLIFFGIFVLSNLLVLASTCVLTNSFLDLGNVVDLLRNLILHQLVANTPLPNLLGGIAILIVSILVTFLLNGYLYRILEKSVNNEEELPDFNNIKLLFIQGVKMVLVGLCYAIIPMILITLSLYNPIAQFNGTISGFLLLIGIILSIIFSIIEIMALNYLVANSGKFSSAFEIKEIWAILKEVGFIKFIGTIIFSGFIALIIFLAVVIILAIIGIVIAFIPILRILPLIVIYLVNYLVYAYFSMYFTRVFGLLYNEREEI